MSDSGFHARFASVLRGADPAPLRDFIVPDGKDAIGVYRNTIVRGVIDVLGDAFPAARFLAGEGNFAALARSYWQASPPPDGAMLLYGGGFAEHMVREAPPGMPALLPAIARIDRAWGEAHHSADASVLTLADIRTLDPDAFAALRLGLHPSVRLVTHDRPVFATWSAARFESRVEPAGAPGTEAVLVWRPAMEVLYRTVTAIESEFLNALSDGLPLGEAAEHSGASPDLFIRLLKGGIFARTTP